MQKVLNAIADLQARLSATPDDRPQDYMRELITLFWAHVKPNMEKSQRFVTRMYDAVLPLVRTVDQKRLRFEATATEADRAAYQEFKDSLFEIEQGSYWKTMESAYDYVLAELEENAGPIRELSNASACEDPVQFFNGVNQTIDSIDDVDGLLDVAKRLFHGWSCLIASPAASSNEAQQAFKTAYEAFRDKREVITADAPYSDCSFLQNEFNEPDYWFGRGKRTYRTNLFTVELNIQDSH